MKVAMVHGRLRAFTLIEVVLAITISVGILVVAIYFYHQSANLRTQLIEETDKLTTVRLLMQRIANDLRAVEGSGSYSFIGTSNTLSFVTAEHRLTGRWNSAPGNRWQVGLYQVAYQLNESMEGTNVVVGGFVRDERPIDAAPAAALGTKDESTNRIETLSVEAPATNSTTITTNILQQPITEIVQALQFEYWDGAGWTNLWQSFTPPIGVRVMLATEPLSAEGAPEEAHHFRRTIYIPTAAKKAVATNELSDVTLAL